MYDYGPLSPLEKKENALSTIIVMSLPPSSYLPTLGYANTPQQQQQPGNYQGPPPSLLAARPDFRRSRSPGTPPLPDPTPPARQDATPQYHGVPSGPQSGGVPSQGQLEVGGGVVSGRKHRRSEDQGGGESSSKRVHTEGGEGGGHPSPMGDGGKDARSKSFRGRASRWGDRDKGNGGKVGWGGGTMALPCFAEEPGNWLFGHLAIFFWRERSFHGGKFISTSHLYHSIVWRRVERKVEKWVGVPVLEQKCYFCTRSRAHFTHTLLIANSVVCRTAYFHSIHWHRLAVLVMCLLTRWL